MLFFSDSGCSLRSLAHPTHTLYKLYPNTLKTTFLKLSDTDQSMVNLRMLEFWRRPSRVLKNVGSLRTVVYTL